MIYEEWYYTANDLDSGDSITDVCYLPLNTRDGIAYEKIERKIQRHPIISITGNTWELDDIGKTGKQVDYDSNSKGVTVIKEREDNSIQYPSMQF